MKAVILVAGIASRLRPLTDHTPKCLLKVDGIPILKRMIDNLLAEGVQEFIMVTGYLREQILTFFETYFPGLNVTYIYNEVFDSTNNIYSLWLAKEEVAGEEFLLLDGDILFDRSIIGLLLDNRGQSALALRSRGEVGAEDMKVQTDQAHYVRRINKHMTVAAAAGESIGIEMFSCGASRKLFAELKIMIEGENKVDVWYEEAFQRIIEQGVLIKAVDVGELECMELDTVEDLRQAEGLGV